MRRLGEVLAAAGQQLALDPAPGERLAGQQPAGAEPAGTGTVGGTLATGTAGPRRLRYGTPRDLVIGITVVRADGTVASSGGKVVKNVAGYDLGKLFAASYGTLGLIAEAVFRLHPLPAAASTPASWSSPTPAWTRATRSPAACSSTWSSREVSTTRSHRRGGAPQSSRLPLPRATTDSSCRPAARSSALACPTLAGAAA